jgi:DNA-binding SARP family transcriptional activator/Tfp pilus assembly protein PilF/DNA-binding XRE family transcriptional regulator
MEPGAETVGRLLRERRQRAGLTQQEVAARAGLSLRALRDIEQGRVRRPRAASVRRLAAVVGTGDETAAQTSRLWVGTLGPLVVRRGGTDLPVSSPMQRRLLGLLALNAGRTVASGEIVDVLWADQPPKNCLKLVHGHVARLRRLLEPERRRRDQPAVIVRRGTGYQLVLAADQLDLARFGEQVALARQAQAAGRTGEALRLWADALTGWRGRALSDVEGMADHPALLAAAQRRLDTTLRYADLALQCGQHREAAEQLRGLAHDQPLHEGVHARLMLALAGAGQQAAALTLYAGIRDRLGYELGVEPGAELRGAHLRVLRQELTLGSDGRQQLAVPAERALPVPGQLPADVATFTGRALYLHRLDTLLPSAGEPAAAVVVSAIDGAAGVGKTALAVHWAHRVRDRFPDGQLYVNLHGFHRDKPATSPAEALRGFLDALGVPPHRVPADLQAQAGLYRSLLADRRILVLLDNARDADQVRPLLPGSPGCLVVVTSRNQLPGLVAAEGAHPMTLDLLTSGEAVDLLARRLGPHRVAAEPRAVDSIVSSCARLPLALAIVAARAVTRPDLSLTALAAELHDSRRGLDAFAVGDAATDVRAVLSWSYAALSRPAARLFALLGIHAGPDLALPAAASACGLPVHRVRPLLAELAGAHLVAEQGAGRYACHDLLRAYAAELARGLGEAEIRAARNRVFDHYLRAAHTADRLLETYRPQIALPESQPGVAAVPLVDNGQALDWFTAERRVLMAAIAQAAETGFDTYAWRLAWTLADFLDRQGFWPDLVAVERAALAAAGRLADPSAEAHSRRDLATGCIRLGRYDEARAELARALDLFARVGDHAGEAYTHLTISYSYDQQGDPEGAMESTRRGLELYRLAGDLAGQARALNGIGWDHTQLGEHQRALDYCRQALALQQEAGDREGQPYTWDSLGYAHHHLGDHRDAIACYERALALYREFGNRYGEADTLVNAGDTHLAAGDHDRARQAWQQALQIRLELGLPDAAEVRTKLSAVLTDAGRSG